MANVLRFSILDESNNYLNIYSKKNLETLFELHDRYDEENIKFRKLNGIDEKIRKESEERLKDKKGVTPIPANLIGLSDEDQEKFIRQITPYITKGLEFKAIIELEKQGKKYYFAPLIGSNLTPVCKKSTSFFKNHYEPYGTIGFKSIPKLVTDIKEYLKELSEHYYNAKMDPLFYTILEEKPIFTDEQKKDLKDFKTFKEIKEMPFIYRQLFKLFLKKLSNCKDTVRGFNEEEIKEFENLFY